MSWLNKFFGRKSPLAQARPSPYPRKDRRGVFQQPIGFADRRTTLGVEAPAPVDVVAAAQPAAVAAQDESQSLATGTTGLETRPTPVVIQPRLILVAPSARAVASTAPVLATLPTPAVSEATTGAHLRLRPDRRRVANSVAEVLAIFDRPVRALLPGVVAPAQVHRCVALDLRAGIVGLVLEESFLSSPHMAAVLHQIEIEWGFRVQFQVVAAPAVIQAVAHSAARGEPIRYESRHLAVYDDIFQLAADGKVSDIHFNVRESNAAGEAVGTISARTYGQLRPWLELPSQLMMDALGAAFGGRMRPGTANTESYSASKPVAFMTTQKVNGRQFEGRVNGRPHFRGSYTVIRLLESNQSAASIPTLTELGYLPSQVEMFDLALRRKWGLILAVGATGSGKSTSLRSLLIQLLAAEYLAIYMVETPVEYEIPGVIQLSVPEDVEDDEAALRALLGCVKDGMRMDPDAMGVGEIRDAKTARLAINFSSTDHRCLSTLHAGGVLEALSRLTGDSLAVPADELAHPHMINLLFSQKLLSALCPHCKVEASDARLGLSTRKRDVLARKYGLDHRTMAVANPNGCVHCKPRLPGVASNGTRGVRMAAEILMPTHDMLPLIRLKDWAGIEQIWRGQRTVGFGDPDMTGKTAYEHGLYLASVGEVSPFEVETSFEPLESYRLFNKGGST